MSQILEDVPILIEHSYPTLTCEIINGTIHITCFDFGSLFGIMYRNINHVLKQRLIFKHGTFEKFIIKSITISFQKNVIWFNVLVDDKIYDELKLQFNLDFRSMT